MDGNGGIVGVKNTGQSGRWSANDVLINRNDLRTLLHRWPLISDANDLVGDLDLTNNGTVTFSANGASFNGSNQWLSGTLAKPNAWTMSAWVTPVDFSAQRSVACACPSDGDSQLAWGLWNSKFGELGTLMCFGASVNDPQIYVKVAAELTTAHYPMNAPTLAVAVYVDGALSVYRDSGLVGAVSGISPSVGSTFFSIGRSGAMNAGYWYGTIADVRLYSVALTPADIALMAAAGPNP